MIVGYQKNILNLIHLFNELSKLLGKDTEFHFKSGKLNKVLMLGIQGSGKTTMNS